MNPLDPMALASQSYASQTASAGYSDFDMFDFMPSARRRRHSEPMGVASSPVPIAMPYQFPRFGSCQEAVDCIDNLDDMKLTQATGAVLFSGNDQDGLLAQAILHIQDKPLNQTSRRMNLLHALADKRFGRNKAYPELGHQLERVIEDLPTSTRLIQRLRYNRQIQARFAATQTELARFYDRAIAYHENRL